MGGIRSSVCGCQSDDPFVWFWRETHTKGLCTGSPTRPEEEKGRKVLEKAKESIQQKGARETGRQKEAVRKGKHGREERRTEVRKMTAKAR